MAEIIVTIKDEMPVNGKMGVSFTWDGDYVKVDKQEDFERLTPAQKVAANLGNLISFLEGTGEPPHSGLKN